MKYYRFILGVIALTLTTHAQVLWINEFHYDNTSGDLGEFVEIAAPISFTDIANVTLTLYNGNDGTPYGVTHSLDTFTLGSTTDGLNYFTKEISGLQNGAPDGFSLDWSGDVLQFISYEGQLAATTGPALGLTSIDIGVSQDGSLAAGVSLGLIGTGSEYGDFTWAELADDTPGSLNISQAITPVPEPGEYALVAGLCMLAFAAYHRQTRRQEPAKQ